jgi:nicotinamide riboside transporter PnuC
MSQFLDKILPALIGVIGTVLVALIGFYQWRKQQEKAKRAEFITARLMKDYGAR